MTVPNWHHCRSSFPKFLLRLYSFLAIRFVSLFTTISSPVALYTVDTVAGKANCDPRAAEIYQLLKKQRCNYFEFVHVSSLKRALLNIVRRRRAVCFFEHLGAQNAELQLAAIFRRLKIQRLFSIDDYRHTAPLIIAAKKLNIHTIAVQHGCNFSQAMFPKNRPVFDNVIVWSDFFAQQFSSFCPEQKITICQHPRYQQEFIQSRNAIMLVEEIGIAADQLEQFLLPLAIQVQFPIYLRLRPGQKQPSALYRKFFTGNQCLNSDDVYQDLSQVAVVIGSYSSVLYQAILVGCGVVVYPVPYFTEPIVNKKAATLAATPEQLQSAITAELSITDAQRYRRREEIWGSKNSNSFEAVLFS